jgi:cytosine deaminase
VALPATDLFLNGRGYSQLVPRGVAPAHRLLAAGGLAAVATNNVLNPFTPYGDASLIRMANLYANVAELSRHEDMKTVFDMIGSSAARLMNAAHGLRVGGEATIVLLDCNGPAAAVREISRVLAGWKAGRQSFLNGRPAIFRP